MNSVVVVEDIDTANTITACSFCNSTTSRDRNMKSMEDLLSSPGTHEEIKAVVLSELKGILDRKRVDVRRKLECIRRAYDQLVIPALAGTPSVPG